MPGGVYHVTNRGVDRTDIVRDDTDRQQWYRLFTRVAIRCHWRESNNTMSEELPADSHNGS